MFPIGAPVVSSLSEPFCVAPFLYSFSLSALSDATLHNLSNAVAALLAEIEIVDD